MAKKETAVDWLVNQIENGKIEIVYSNEIHSIKCIPQIVDQAKEMEQEILDDIDFDLTMIEDYAKGETGKNITKLRKKIQTLKYGK